MDRFNVLIILMDSQKPDNLHCYGYYRETSPNIDKIADEGVVFLNDFTVTNWTPPSHASLFTGRYYSGHQTVCLGGGKTRLPEDIPTMGEALNVLGYETAAFSNNFWVNNDVGGVLRGFKDCFYPNSMTRQEENRKIASELFDELEEPEKRDKGSLFTTYLIKKWLEERPGKPFLIFINFVEPHHPYTPSQPFRSRMYPPGVDDKRAERVPQIEGDGRLLKGLPRNPQDWLILQSLLDGETLTVDNRIGILVEYLKEKGIYDDTIIIITSDHGDTLWEHLKCMSHSSLYDSNVHTPLVAKGPKEYFPKGQKVESITQIVDIFPAIADALRIEDPKIRRSIQGVSFLPALNDESKRKIAVAEMRNPIEGWIPDCWCKMVRTMEYKYIGCSNEIVWLRASRERPQLHLQMKVRSHEKDELYNLVEDPTEQYNLLSSGTVPFKISNDEIWPKVRELKGMLEELFKSIEILPIRVPKEAFDQMRIWGYYQDIFPV